jgi:hypothetical protein
MFLLPKGDLAVMYANEKHVVENPSYSQVVSERVSKDHGITWGPEIYVAAEPGGHRPGMPVCTRMKNRQYIAVYEICGPENCGIYFKTSKNGTDWPAGLGTPIPSQLAGPYVLSLSDGRLLVTSNSGNISCSEDFGATWTLTAPAWRDQTLWGSLYEFDRNQVAAVSSVPRAEKGHNIQIKFGTISQLLSGPTGTSR